jgi:hypothetical protein
MKKWLFMVVFPFIILAGCNNDKPMNTEEEPVDQVEDVSEVEENTETDLSSKSADKDEEVVKDSGLKNYRPEIGIKKVFYSGEVALFTEEIVAADETHVQRVITLGSNKTVQILKWVENEITIVYENIELDDPYVDLISSYEPNIEPEILISLDGGSADWELVQSDSVEETPYGKFEDVYIISRVTNEVEGEDTVYTHYFAPGMGLIKEVVEVTGDNGYKEESVIQIVE